MSERKPKMLLESSVYRLNEGIRAQGQSRSGRPSRAPSARLETQRLQGRETAPVEAEALKLQACLKDLIWWKINMRHRISREAAKGAKKRWMWRRRAEGQEDGGTEDAVPLIAKSALRVGAASGYHPLGSRSDGALTYAATAIFSNRDFMSGAIQLLSLNLLKTR
jgi:hypothetical protein